MFYLSLLSLFLFISPLSLSLSHYLSYYEYLYPLSLLCLSPSVLTLYYYICLCLFVPMSLRVSHICLSLCHTLGCIFNYLPLFLHSLFSCVHWVIALVQKSGLPCCGDTIPSHPQEMLNSKIIIYGGSGDRVHKGHIFCWPIWCFTPFCQWWFSLTSSAKLSYICK